MLADVALGVLAFVAAAPARCAGVEHHRHAPARFQRRQHVLQPAPVRRTGGRHAPLEAVVGVVLVHVGRKALIPHRVGGLLAEGAQAAVCVDPRRGAHRVALADVGAQIVDEGVHLGGGHVVGLQLLPVEPHRIRHIGGRQRFDVLAQPGCDLCPMAQHKLDQQPGAARSRVVEFVAVLRVKDVGEQKADASGREELAGAAALLGKLANQVLVGAPDDVGLHIAQPQPLLAQDIEQARQRIVVEHALITLGGVEVAAVDDAVQVGILTRNRTQVVGHAFAQPGCLAADG